MWETLQSNPEKFAPMVVCIVIALAIVATKGIRAWRENEDAKRDADLKAEMVAKGWSADDNLRVLAAKENDPKLAETIYQKKL
jgi:hypothetical protein